MRSFNSGYRATVLPKGMQVSSWKDPVAGGDEGMCPSVERE